MYLGITDSLAPLVDKDTICSKFMGEYQKMNQKKKHLGKKDGAMKTYSQYLINLLQYIETEKLYKEYQISMEDVRAVVNQLKSSEGVSGWQFSR